jgi:hypothetical protein
VTVYIDEHGREWVSHCATESMPNMGTFSEWLPILAVAGPAVALVVWLKYWAMGHIAARPAAARERGRIVAYWTIAGQLVGLLLPFVMNDHPSGKVEQRWLIACVAACMVIGMTIGYAEALRHSNQAKLDRSPEDRLSPA